jgi:hypothetical protein
MPELVDIFNKKFKYEKIIDQDKTTKIAITSLIKDNVSIDNTFSIRPTNNFITEITQKKTLDLSKFPGTKISKFELKFNFVQKLFRCFKKGKKNEIFLKIQNKILKTISYENLIKMSLQLRIIKFLLLENYHRALLKICLGKTPEKKLHFEEAFHFLENDKKEHNKILNEKLLKWLNYS